MGGLRISTRKARPNMAVKTNPGNYFEDFEVGSELVHAVPRTITEGDQSLYIGLTGDRYPLHCSAEFARTLGYERETVNDLLTFHMVFGKTVNDVSLNAVANLGYASVKFLAPVYRATLSARSARSSAKKRTAAASTASSGCGAWAPISATKRSSTTTAG